MSCISRFQHRACNTREVSNALCSSSHATHDALLTLYRTRFSQQIETASSETIDPCWY
jgi:hypothetical protein